MLAGVALLAVAAAWPSDRVHRVSKLQAAVLGVVEGLTEYLPVSSTGHLILASHAMGLSELGSQSGPLGREVVKSPAVSAFEIVIQFGAVLAVLGLYRQRVGQMALGLVGRNPDGLRLVKLLALGVLPASAVGLALHEPIVKHLFGPLTVSVALIVGGVLMIAVEVVGKRRLGGAGVTLGEIAYWQAIVVGLAQVLSLWPGTSRSMITILAAMMVGLDRVSAAEFSFLLALPTLAAATVYKAVTHAQELIEMVGVGASIVGTVTSALVAVVAVRLFVKWLNHHGLIPFGAYRVLLGAAVLWYFRGSIL